MTSRYITDEQRTAVLIELLHQLTPAELIAPTEVWMSTTKVWMSTADVQTTDAEEALFAIYARLADAATAELAKGQDHGMAVCTRPHLFMSAVITATRWVAETVAMLSAGANYWQPKELTNALVAAVAYHEVLLNSGQPDVNLPALREAAFTPLGLTTY